MASFDSVFKTEVARLARKELRAEVSPLVKVVSAQRKAIAALRKQVADLERQVRRLGTSSKRQVRAPSVDEQAEAKEGEVRNRFSATRLAAHRQKLGLSAQAYARLVGASSLSVYKWEQGKVRPRAAQIKALAAVRNLSKSQALEKLAA
jgi:DNA-binding transcriptional regulator YiaG